MNENDIYSIIIILAFILGIVFLTKETDEERYKRVMTPPRAKARGFRPYPLTW